MDWSIGWVFWIGCSYFLTIVNCYFVLVKKAKYNYIIGVSGIAFFSVALLEELRMFSQWIEDGEVGMLTHALQNLPIQFKAMQKHGWLPLLPSPRHILCK